MEDLSVFDNIVFLLNNAGIEFDILEHGFVHRSEDAAKVRGTNLQEAAKALVLRAKKGNQKNFFMCVVPGHLQMDLRRVKELVNCKNVALASPEDVLMQTGLKIGTIPPFPSLFSLPGYCEAQVLENEYVVFSAGSHYRSIRMRSEDWKEIAGVVVERFAKDAVL